MTEGDRLPLVVLISGSGSNLQAIIDRAAEDLPVELRAVISNRAGAYGLERARRAGVPTRVLDHRAFPSRETYDAALADLIEGFRPGLVVLAGFMRILSPGLVARFRGRMLNIHPSLLPQFRGLHTHERALQAGESVHGASVHFVTDELDGGPVVLQARVPVEPDDDSARLAARVLEREHQIYPEVIRWFAEGRLSLEDGEVRLHGQRLAGPVVWDFAEPAEAR